MEVVPTHPGAEVTCITSIFFVSPKIEHGDLAGEVGICIVYGDSFELLDDLEHINVDHVEYIQVKHLPSGRLQLLQQDPCCAHVWLVDELANRLGLEVETDTNWGASLRHDCSKTREGDFLIVVSLGLFHMFYTSIKYIDMI